jgi:uncharacterized membrane protein YfcA
VTALSSLDYAVGAGAGFLAGGINALAGGGSLVLYPALVAVGLPSVPANVTNSVALWPGYFGNLLGLGPTLHEARPDITRLFVPAMIGSGVGSAALLLTPSGAFDIAVPFLVFGAALLLLLQPRLRRLVDARPHARRARALQLTTLVAGVYGGYFGGGLGVILLAVLGLTLGSALRTANAVKGGLTFLISTVTVVAFAIFGEVAWLMVVAVAPAALLGGAIGGRFASTMSERLLRRLVIGFGFAMAGWLGYRAAR